MNDYFSNLARKEPPPMMITTCHLERDVVKQIDMLCKAKNISRSEFIRESLKMSINRVHSTAKMGFIYLIYVARMDCYKIGRTEDITKTIDVYFGGRKIPGDKELIHTFQTNDMYRAEKILLNYFKAKQIEDTECFELETEDVQWFKNKSYLSIPEIKYDVETF